MLHSQPVLFLRRSWYAAVSGYSGDNVGRYVGDFRYQSGGTENRNRRHPREIFFGKKLDFELTALGKWMVERSSVAFGSAHDAGLRSLHIVFQAYRESKAA